MIALMLVVKDLLFLTSSVRKCTRGHSTSNISMLWGEVSVCEGVGDTGPEDELGSPGEGGYVAPVEGIGWVFVNVLILVLC